MSQSIDGIQPTLKIADLEKLLFVRSDLADLTKDEKSAILAKVNSIGLAELRQDTVILLLCVMHEAREIAPQKFLSDLFLPWQSLKQKTKNHFERIAKELVRIGEFQPGSIEEATHLANLYRNIVSDLFDPYLTLVVACFQMKEGNFVSIPASDLADGERTKFEYLLKRVKEITAAEPHLLSGYHPVVRNAVSHSGAHGVVYQPNRVVFKDIKRGAAPIVTPVVWTNEELQLHVLQLLECIMSIEVTVEIFGLDVSSQISEDFESTSNFMLHALSAEQRKQIGERRNTLAAKVLDHESLPINKKQEILATILFYNFGLRNMACTRVKLSSEKSAIVLEIPSAAIDVSDNSQLFDRMIELVRYGILARSVFESMYDTFCVEEYDQQKKTKQLFVQLQGIDLDAWIDESAGIVDLLNDSKWFLGDTPISVAIDFDAMAAMELAKVGDPFPRKIR